MKTIADRHLPFPRILHPWPEKRFLVNHPRWEPGAVAPPAGICAGGGEKWPALPRPPPRRHQECYRVVARSESDKEVRPGDDGV